MEVRKLTVPLVDVLVLCFARSISPELTVCPAELHAADVARAAVPKL